MDGVPEAKEGHSTPLYFYGFAKKLARRKLKCEDLNKTSIHYFIYLPVVYILMLSVRNHTTIKISTSFFITKKQKNKNNYAFSKRYNILYIYKCTYRKWKTFIQYIYIYIYTLSYYFL